MGAGSRGDVRGAGAGWPLARRCNGVHPAITRGRGRVNASAPSVTKVPCGPAGSFRRTSNLTATRSASADAERGLTPAARSPMGPHGGSGEQPLHLTELWTRTRLGRMPHPRMRLDPTEAPIPDGVLAALSDRFTALRAELGLSVDYPEEALAEASAVAAEAPGLPQRDETDLPLFTSDPPGSMDLDQAPHLERDGEGHRIRYAIADVPTFVPVGGHLDRETRARGQTVYCPDLRVPLHPVVLSEAAASLLPDAVRPAFVWDLRLDGSGELASAEVHRSMVRSRERLDYAEVQAAVDSGTGDERFLLLREIGERRIAQERARGGASLPMPEQQVRGGDDGGFTLEFRPPVPAEGLGYGDFIRSLDRTNPRHLALIHEATSLFRGAGYTAFDGEVPAERQHAAVAAPYAHVTAPLRRLVDRFALVVCEAVCRGADVPDPIRSSLPLLPELMRDSDRRARAAERACADATEAAVLHGREGETFTAVVLDHTEKGMDVQLVELPVLSQVTGDRAPLGSAISVRLGSGHIRAGAL